MVAGATAACLMDFRVITYSSCLRILRTGTSLEVVSAGDIVLGQMEAGSIERSECETRLEVVGEAVGLPGTISHGADGATGRRN